MPFLFRKTYFLNYSYTLAKHGQKLQYKGKLTILVKEIGNNKGKKRIKKGIIFIM